jgi:hypothetical protein
MYNPLTSSNINFSTGSMSKLKKSWFTKCQAMCHSLVKYGKTKNKRGNSFAPQSYGLYSYITFFENSGSVHIHASGCFLQPN